MGSAAAREAMACVAQEEQEAITSAVHGFYVDALLSDS